MMFQSWVYSGNAFKAIAAGCSESWKLLVGRVQKLHADAIIAVKSQNLSCSFLPLQFYL
jgi:hypothetical protein